MKLKLGRDVNGNKTIKVTLKGARGFSVQTLGNMPKTNRMTPDSIDEQVVLAELKAYVQEFGSSRQKELLGC